MRALVRTRAGASVIVWVSISVRVKVELGQ
jgi:hypothetical protein